MRKKLRNHPTMIEVHIRHEHVIHLETREVVEDSVVATDIEQLNHFMVYRVK